MLLQGQTLKSRYIIGSNIDSGKFGQIFSVTDTKHPHLQLVAKYEKTDTKEQINNRLKFEYNKYKKMKPFHIRHIPKVYDFFNIQSGHVLIMQRLGCSMDYIFKHHKIDKKSICHIAIHCIFALSKIHQAGVIHQDIKPQNMMIGTSSRQHYVYFVDFGLSKSIETDKPLDLMKRSRKGFRGTVKFASISAHLGHEQSEKDDLESLGYVLIYLFTKSLPWSHCQHSKNEKNDVKNEILQIKKHISVDKLCSKLPGAFSLYIKYIRTLVYRQKPDYNLLISFFKKELKNYTNKYLFIDLCWLHPGSFYMRETGQSSYYIDNLQSPKKS